MGIKTETMAKNEKAVLGFYQSYTKANHAPPTLRATAAQANLSVMGALNVLRRLARKGKLRHIVERRMYVLA